VRALENEEDSGGSEQEAGGGVDKEGEGDAEEVEEDNDGALAAREGTEAGTGDGCHGHFLGSAGESAGSLDITQIPRRA